MKTARNLLITVLCTLCFFVALIVCGYTFVFLIAGGTICLALLGAAYSIKVVFNAVFKALSEPQPGSKGS